MDRALGNSAGTKTTYRSVLSARVLPAIGRRSLASLANDREAVAQLLTVTMADLSYSRRKQARLIITAVMDEAAAAGKIAAHLLGGIELANRGTKKDLSDFVFPEHAAQMAVGLRVSVPLLTTWFSLLMSLVPEHPDYGAGGTRVTEVPFLAFTETTSLW